MVMTMRHNRACRCFGAFEHRTKNVDDHSTDKGTHMTEYRHSGRRGTGKVAHSRCALGISTNAELRRHRCAPKALARSGVEGGQIGHVVCVGRV